MDGKYKIGDILICKEGHLVRAIPPNARCKVLDYDEHNNYRLRFGDNTFWTREINRFELCPPKLKYKDSPYA